MRVENRKGFWGLAGWGSTLGAWMRLSSWRDCSAMAEAAPPPDPPAAPYEGAGNAIGSAGHTTAERPRPLPGPASTVGSGAGETTPFVPIVGRQMRSTLTGRNFDIKALTSELQEVPLEGETVWQWQVTPLHWQAGSDELVLTTAVVATAPDGSERVPKRTVKARPIEVEVSLMSQIEDALDTTSKWLPGLRRGKPPEEEGN